MKKHILQENYEKMFGSIKEDWWDDMDASAQAAYIKKHPGSKQAQQADAGGGEDDYDMGAVPGSRELDDTPEDDDYDSEKGSSLTSAPGRVPDEKPSGDKPSAEPTTPSIGDAKETYKKTKQERDAANKEGQDAKWELQQAKEAEEKAGMFGKGKARKRVEDAEKGLEAAEKRKKVAGKAHMKAYDDYNKAQEGQGDRQKDINSGKIEPETKEEADLAAADARDSVKKQKKNRAYELQNPDPRDPTPPAEREYYWNRTVADAEKRAEEAGAKAKEFGAGRTGNELNQETLMIDGKQYNRITEGKIDSKFIKYRVYDKISDEIDKVEPDDFNLRDFNSLKKPLIKFIQREVSKDKKIDTGDLRKAIDKSDFDDKVFGRGGIIDGWYKKSERDFPKFLKRNSNLKWKNYNASSLTYGIGKPLYKIVDSLLDGINSLVPESAYAFSEFYKRFKK